MHAERDRSRTTCNIQGISLSLYCYLSVSLTTTVDEQGVAKPLGKLQYSRAVPILPYVSGQTCPLIGACSALPAWPLYPLPESTPHLILLFESYILLLDLISSTLSLACHSFQHRLLISTFHNHLSWPTTECNRTPNR